MINTVDFVLLEHISHVLFRPNNAVIRIKIKKNLQIVSLLNIY